MAVQTPPELPPEQEPRHDYKDAQATDYSTPTTHPKGSQPGEYNAADWLLWFICWPWALMRLLGRHHSWTRTKQNWSGVGATVGVVLVFTAIAVATTPPVEQPIVTPAPAVTETSTPAPTQVAATPKATPKPKPAPAVTETSTPAPTQVAATPKATPKPRPVMTSGQRNALQSAHGYIDLAGFSKAGLIQQLSSSAGEGYSRADATYAANHVGADWNQEAVESAQSYLDMTGFSRSGLIEQLSSSAGEKFTPAQARYAVNKVYS
jgi:hypothetical protein